MSSGQAACRVPQQAYFMLNYYEATCDAGTQNDGNTITTRAKLKHILEKARQRERGSVGVVRQQVEGVALIRTYGCSSRRM